jgi:4-nitrophenyl phosphatase
MTTGEDVLFVTNNSALPVSDVEDRLGVLGVPAEGRVVSSAEAAASRVQPGERVLLCAGEGARRALVDRGAVLVEENDTEHVDVVVVGLTRALTYDLLARASLSIQGGARLLATNDDSTYPTPEGLLPGGGAILAAVVTASGATPEIAGKPHSAMAELVRARLGPEGIVIGDRADTDGAFARTMGYQFGLVLSGVTTSDTIGLDPEPDHVGDDLAHLVARLAGGEVAMGRGQGG